MKYNFPLDVQHVDGDAEDYGPFCSGAFGAWTTEDFCRLSRQGPRCSEKMILQELFRSVTLMGDESE